MKMRWTAVCVVVGGFLGTGAPGWGGEPIVIGSVGPASPPGSVAQWSEASAGIKLAAEMINEKGGVLGRQIQVKFEDSQGIPEKGRAAIEKLITQEKVPAAVGGNHSSVCLAMSEVVHRYRVPFVNVNCWADAIREKGFPELFNTSVNNGRISVGGAQFIKSLNVRSVVTLAENTDFGLGLARNLQTQLKELAPGVSFSMKVLDREAKDFTPVMLELKQNPPNVVVTILDPPAGYVVINQLHEYGVAPTAKTWLLDLDALAELPDFWDNVKAAGRHLTGIVLFHPSMKLTDLGKQVRDRHMKGAGREASRVVFQGFDAMWVMADAIRRAGSVQSEALVKALPQTRLAGTRGTVTFRKDPGPFFQQWFDVPYSIIQYTEATQPLAKAPIVFPSDQATGKLSAPK
jgi:branched-chain amino acid transport system substrate-binding protein